MCDRSRLFAILCAIEISEMGRIRFRRVRFQTSNSVSFLVLTELLSEFLSAHHSCAKAGSPSSSQSSPSSLQNSVISLFRSSTLETVLRPFSRYRLEGIFSFFWATAFFAKKAKTEMRHFCIKHYKTRYTPEKRDRIKIQGMVSIQNEIGTRYECPQF